MLGLSHDDSQPVPATDLRSLAGLKINGPADFSAPLKEVTLPGGSQAVLTYRGPYAGLPAAYDQLFGAWMPASGEEPADTPSVEVYLNSPMDAALEDLLTELHLPLR
jgi:AraC family transcriptional regulator